MGLFKSEIPCGIHPKPEKVGTLGSDLRGFRVILFIVKIESVCKVGPVLRQTEVCIKDQILLVACEDVVLVLAKDDELL